MTKGKIAFIYYPHLPDDARLETMPFAKNTVEQIAKDGWEIDLYLWERDILKYRNLYEKNINPCTLESFKQSQVEWLERSSLLNMLRKGRILIETGRRRDYRFVIGLGQIGAHIGSLVANSNKCPLIYFNDEFPSTWPNTIWTELERNAAKNAALIVVPDRQRKDPLYRDLELPATIPCAELPNIPSQTPPQEIDWHQRLGIPENTALFLHAGTLADWAQIPELLCTLHDWPRKSALILHGRSTGHSSYRAQLQHLDPGNSAIWTKAHLSEAELNSLVSCCHGNFALYRNLGPNIEFIGTSSGKLMRSIFFGTPVIASKLPSFSFVENHGLGLLVNHPREIPDAVRTILEKHHDFARNCRQYAHENMSFDRYWDIFCEDVLNATRIDLRSAP